MSIIAAGTTTTTALSSTGNTDGTLQFQVNGTTASVTLNTLGAIGVGSTPNFGTAGQALVSAGSTAAPTWASVTTSPAGSNTQIQYNNSGSFGASSALTFDSVNLATNTAGSNATMGINSTSSSLYLQSRPDVSYSRLVSSVYLLDLLTVANQPITFSANSAERFRIGGSGQLGIGGANYGTSGQVLTSGGASAAPSWASPSGGSLIFLSEVTASNSSTVDIETTFDSTYDEYVIKVTNLIPETSNTGIRARVKIGGVYDDTSNYSSASTVTQSIGDSYTGNDGGTTMFLTTSFAGANRPTSFEFLVHNPSSTSYAKGFNWSGLLYRNGATLSASFVGAGLNSSTSACTGVRFYMTADRIVSGTFRLYGIKKS